VLVDVNTPGFAFEIAVIVGELAVVVVVLPNNLGDAIDNVWTEFQFDGCTRVASVPSSFPLVKPCLREIAIMQSG
jgi:hypothetical protein